MLKQLDTACDSDIHCHQNDCCSLSVSYKHCLPYNFRLNSLRNIVKSKNPSHSMFDDSGSVESFLKQKIST